MMFGIVADGGQGIDRSIPAANSRNYDVFLFGLFVIGTGLVLLQDSLKSCVTILGPTDSAGKRISIMGVCDTGAGASCSLDHGSHYAG